jgi:hypothetical protein
VTRTVVQSTIAPVPVPIPAVAPASTTDLAISARVREARAEAARWAAHQRQQMSVNALSRQISQSSQGPIQTGSPADFISNVLSSSRGLEPTSVSALNTGTNFSVNQMMLKRYKIQELEAS